jgi:ABC-type phosphate transport system substrate-binding protein
MKNIRRSGLMFITLTLSLAGGAATADVVAVVSAKSPIIALSKSQLADIFLGKTTRFPDGSPAVAVDQAEGSAARDEFYDRVAGKSAAQIKAFWAKIIFTGRGQPPPTVSSAIELKRRIKENPASIGYLDRSLLDDGIRVVF